MPKKLNYDLNEEDLQTIKQAIQYEKDRRVVKRVTGLRLLHEGHSAKEVADILQVTDVTVYSWHHRWQENGIEGLHDAPRSGRPAKADEAYRRAIDETLASDPADHNYDFAIWTLDRLREHLALKTGTVLSYNRLWEVMNEMGYAYRRPTQDLSHAQDAEAHEQAKALLDELKKGAKTPILNSSLWTKRP